VIELKSDGSFKHRHTAAVKCIAGRIAESFHICRLLEMIASCLCLYSWACVL